MEAFCGRAASPPGSIALGSVKSNIGHLKARGRRRRPAQGRRWRCTTRCCRRASTSTGRTRTWTGPRRRSRSTPSCATGRSARGRSRVAGVSAFGFGGTNFHIVMEEYVPDRHASNGNGSSASVPVAPPAAASAPSAGAPAAPPPAAPPPAKPPAARGPRARRAGRGGTGQRAAHRAGRGAPGAPPRSDAAQRRGAPRARADRDRLRRRARPGRAKAELALQHAAGRQRRRRGRRCARAASTAAAAARARWRSSTPDRARSTRTCSPSCAGASPSWPTCSTRPIALMASAARGPAAVGHRLRRPGRSRMRWRGPRRSCAAPRSSSRR